MATKGKPFYELYFRNLNASPWGTDGLKYADKAEAMKIAQQLARIYKEVWVRKVTPLKK